MSEEKLKNKILALQRNEITENIIYARLAEISKISKHKEILKRISLEEFAHYNVFKEITQKDIKPNNFKILFYVFISQIFGLNFGLRLMEKGEDLAQDVYAALKEIMPQIDKVIQDEKKHETELLDLIEEERLKYVSSVVLGLNDALVELTGALAGFTLALQNTRLVGIVGLITGIAASLSMAASEYLSCKQEDTQKNPLKASIYTGFAYVATVVFLITPYLLFKNVFFCLGLALFNALIVILIFTFYISVAKNLSFKKRFFEMAFLSLSIALINFGIGLLIRKVFGIEV